MALSRLGHSVERPWLALGEPFLSLLTKMELEPSRLTLYGLYFQCSLPFFRLAFLRALIESLLISSTQRTP